MTGTRTERPLEVARPDGAPSSARPPALVVVKLSESFASVWPRLARDAGLSLIESADPSSLDRLENGVGVVSGAGVEETLATTFRRISPGAAEVAAVGSLPSHRLAVGIVRAGATEYFSLPDDMDALRGWLRERAERLTARFKRRDFVERQAAKYRFEGMVGNSEALRSALEQAARVIPHASVTVLISGETGTGKELLARAIHYNGPRREAPFVDINCAAIPGQLLESELFGHEKGAFTGAAAAKPGLFEVANGGTLFLDEIGHLPLLLQGKLLRVLEERTIRRLGGTRSIQADVRIVAASHVQLERAVERGEFRQDLYYRLNVLQLDLPPLRERGEDVLPLARHFLGKFARDYGLPEPPLTAGAERALRANPWPGNVRELRNAMERAILLGGGTEIDADDVAPRGPAAAQALDVALPFPATLDEVIQAAVRETLALSRGNKSDAARRLAISRSRLQRLLGTGTDAGDSDDDSRGDQ